VSRRAALTIKWIALTALVLSSDHDGEDVSVRGRTTASITFKNVTSLVVSSILSAP
jgi:hypothetical protein